MVLDYPISFARLIWNQAVVLTGFFLCSPQSYAVRLNGPYDPQVALGGSQPQYYDMLASMYSTYMVRGAKFLVHLVYDQQYCWRWALCGWCQVCGRAAALVTTNPSILTDAQHRAYNYVTR